MRRSRKREPKTPIEEAATYLQQLLNTARRSVALRQAFSGAVVRWRRSRTASEKTLVLVVLRPGEPAELATMPASRLVELAERVSDADALAELVRHGRLSL